MSFKIWILTAGLILGICTLAQSQCNPPQSYGAYIKVTGILNISSDYREAYPYPSYNSLSQLFTSHGCPAPAIDASCTQKPSAGRSHWTWYITLQGNLSDQCINFFNQLNSLTVDISYVKVTDRNGRQLNVSFNPRTITVPLECVGGR